MKVCIFGSGLSSLTLAKALVNQKISEIVEALKGLPVSEVLETVKKSNGNKYNRSIAMLEDILENTKGWIQEQQ